MALFGSCPCADWDDHLGFLTRRRDPDENFLRGPVKPKHSSWDIEGSGGGSVVRRNLASSRRLSLSICSRTASRSSFSVVPDRTVMSSSMLDVDFERGSRARLGPNLAESSPGLPREATAESATSLDNEWPRAPD